jgi:hypothetical protein
MTHVCDLLLVVEEGLHDRFHVVCWAFLVELFPVDKEMRRFHVDGERKKRWVLTGLSPYSALVECPSTSVNKLKLQEYKALSWYRNHNLMKPDEANTN